MEEIWKDIKGYEGIYQVSNFGRVKGLNRKDNYGRTIKEKIKKATIQRCGYLYVSLNKNGKLRKFTIHRLVAQNFIPNSSKLPDVNHIDGNKKNNNVTNLEWCTKGKNQEHAYRTGLKTMKKRQGKFNDKSSIAD